MRYVQDGFNCNGNVNYGVDKFNLPRPMRLDFLRLEETHALGIEAARPIFVSAFEIPTTRDHQFVHKLMLANRIL